MKGVRWQRGHWGGREGTGVAGETDRQAGRQREGDRETDRLRHFIFVFLARGKHRSQTDAAADETLTASMFSPRARQSARLA